MEILQRIFIYMNLFFPSQNPWEQARLDYKRSHRKDGRQSYSVTGLMLEPGPSFSKHRGVTDGKRLEELFAKSRFPRAVFFFSS